MSLLQLPDELISKILDYFPINPPQHYPLILAVMHTCRRLHRIGQPVLYREVVVQGLEPLQSLRFLLVKFPERAKIVRAMHLNWQFPIAVWAPFVELTKSPIPKLESCTQLTIQFSTEPRDTPIFPRIPGVLDWTSNCPALQELRILSLGGFILPSPMVLLEFLPQRPPQPTASLKRMAFTFEIGFPVESIGYLWSYCPTWLTSVSISAANDVVPSVYLTDFSNFARELLHLEISGGRYQRDWRLMDLVRMHTPRLEELAFDAPWYWDFQKPLRCLRKLTARWELYHTDQDLVLDCLQGLLPQGLFPGLEELFLCGRANHDFRAAVESSGLKECCTHLGIKLYAKAESDPGPYTLIE